MIDRFARALDNKKAPLRKVRKSAPPVNQLREGQSVIVANTSGAFEYTRINNQLYRSEYKIAIEGGNSINEKKSKDIGSLSGAFVELINSATGGAGTGHIELDNGIIINWGSKLFSGNTTTDDYSKAFVSEVFWTIGGGDASYTSIGTAWNNNLTSINLGSNTASSRRVYWMAIGR